MRGKGRRPRERVVRKGRPGRRIVRSAVIVGPMTTVFLRRASNGKDVRSYHERAHDECCHHHPDAVQNSVVSAHRSVRVVRLLVGLVDYGRVEKRPCERELLPLKGRSSLSAVSAVATKGDRASPVAQEHFASSLRIFLVVVHRRLRFDACDLCRSLHGAAHAIREFHWFASRPSVANSAAGRIKASDGRL